MTVYQVFSVHLILSSQWSQKEFRIEINQHFADKPKVLHGSEHHEIKPGSGLGLKLQFSAFHSNFLPPNASWNCGDFFLNKIVFTIWTSFLTSSSETSFGSLDHFSFTKKVELRARGIDPGYPTAYEIASTPGVSSLCQI